jgi:hypothetical protein
MVRYGMHSATGGSFQSPPSVILIQPWAAMYMLTDSYFMRTDVDAHSYLMSMHIPNRIQEIEPFFCCRYGILQRVPRFGARNRKRGSHGRSVSSGS